MDIPKIGELVSVTFTWKIDNFTKLKTEKHYSEPFAVGDFKWQIVVYPKGSSGTPGKHDLSIYLNVADASSLSSGWSRYAQFSLTVVNQLDPNHSIRVETKHVFSASKSDWGFTSFMPLSELCDCREGFLVNDICVVEAEVAVSQVDYKILKRHGIAIPTPIEPRKHEDARQGPSNVNSVLPLSSVLHRPHSSAAQVVAVQDELDSEHMHTNGYFVQVPNSSISPTTPSSDQVLAFQDAPRFEKVCTEPNDSPIESSIVKEHEEVPTTPVGELMDFRGLGRIEKAFVPLLEEVCLLHPSLIECQRKRSPMFTEWAFTALGRLLHFLKTTKGKDMTEDACEQLQLLWEELDSFRFDLAWLEPYVQSALDMKKFVKRAGEVKELRQNVDALETELKGLMARLAVAEVDREVAKRDLGKAEESYVETNMDNELGYGRC